MASGIREKDLLMVHFTCEIGRRWRHLYVVLGLFLGFKSSVFGESGLFVIRTQYLIDSGQL